MTVSFVESEPGRAQRQRHPLSGRVALITGVSRRAGIGYATARRLAALGASLFLHHYVPHDRDQPWAITGQVINTEGGFRRG